MNHDALSEHQYAARRMHVGDDGSALRTMGPDEYRRLHDVMAHATGSHCPRCVRLAREFMESRGR